MNLLNRHPIELTITELAVDPGDVDRETYPVRIRLSRALSHDEGVALAELAPGTEIEEGAFVVPDTKLDDIAHAHGEWTRLVSAAAEIGNSRTVGHHADSTHMQNQLNDRRMSQMTEAHPHVH